METKTTKTNSHNGLTHDQTEKLIAEMKSLIQDFIGQENEAALDVVSLLATVDRFIGVEREYFDDTTGELIPSIYED
jgi:hypothetical protein